MHRLKVLNQMKMILKPSAIAAGTAVTAFTVATVSATNVVLAAQPNPPKPPTDCDPNKPLVRAKDLPLYFDPEKNKLHKTSTCCDTKDDYPDDTLMSLVKRGRQEIWKANDAYNSFKRSLHEKFETGSAHMQTAIAELRDEENANKRYGAIGAGGLIGLLFSLRGGFFKKIIYTSSGALAVAAACYPETATEIYEAAEEMFSEISTLAYHFSNAAIKDLTGLEISIPELNKLNPVKIIKVWSGNNEEVSKSSPSSSTLMPPIAEQPCHVVSLSSGPPQSGGIPETSLHVPISMSESSKNLNLRDQSNERDKDMYSIRSEYKTSANNM